MRPGEERLTSDEEVVIPAAVGIVGRRWLVVLLRRGRGHVTGRSRAIDVIAGRDNIIDHNGGTGRLNHFFDHFFDDHGRTFVIGGRHNSLTGRTREANKFVFGRTGPK